MTKGKNKLTKTTTPTYIYTHTHKTDGAVLPSNFKER